MKEGLESIGHWFVEELSSYIGLFGSEVSPHILPQYIPGILALREVANQVDLNGQTKNLSKLQKEL